jgi:hypothetical protein
LGQVYATSPCGVLELDGQELTLRLRPRPFSRFFGGASLNANPTTDLELYPALGARGAQGVGIQPPGRSVSYFWTFRRAEVLTTLAAAGFRMNWDERRATR